MLTVNEKLSLIQQARDDIKTSLENKGQIVNTDIRTYADAIDSIKSEDLQEQLDAQDLIIQQLREELVNKVCGGSQLSYSELFALATSIYDTGIADDSEIANFTIADEMICLQRGLKILRGVV